MSINGQSRMIQAQEQLKDGSQSSINSAFKDENTRNKVAKKFPLKASKSPHNHSK